MNITILLCSFSEVMSGDTEIGSPRPRPLSGGFWTLLSWLRREDHLSSNESLSSAGSDRTAVSFAFLTPAHYHGSAPPVVVPPPGPPTDTYKQRVRERNLRRQYDRGITLHRKYGLFRGEGLCGYETSTLPSSRRQGTAGDRPERERRATSECYQRRAAHVPGKRRAPQPPGRVYARCNSLEPTVSVAKRTTRKRPAPQPPVKIIDKPKENIIQKTISINVQSDHDDQELIGHDISTGCKPEKYTKKDTKEGKIKPEKSFLKQIFENKKRNSTVDITTVKVLPSISELDAQAAEIIENNKLNKSDAINHQTIIQAVKENCCTKCFKKPCICKTDTMSSALEQSQNKNASTYTQTENILRNSTRDKNNKVDEKQKLKEMLKEMKDSLPKKPKQENTKNTNIIPNSDASSSQSSKDVSIMEAPTLRIGFKSSNQINNNGSKGSSQTQQTSRKKDELSHVINKQVRVLATVENKPKVIANNILNKTASDGHKPGSSNKEQDISSNENKKLNTPLKISSLLNPIYIPKDTCSQNLPKMNSGDVDTKVIKPDSPDQAKFETAKAVREIVLNSDLKRNPIPALSSPLKAQSNNIKSSVKKPSAELSGLKAQNAHNIASSDEKKERSDVDRLSQHLRRRELVNKLEQSIAKGDERAAAEAASKLAQLRLSCSVLSFTSQILSEPSTSKTQPEKILPQDQIKNVNSNNSGKSLAATVTSKESNSTSKVVGASEPTTSANKVQEERKNATTCVNSIPAVKTSASSLETSASTSKGPLGLNNEGVDIIA